MKQPLPLLPLMTALAVLGLRADPAWSDDTVMQGDAEAMLHEQPADTVLGTPALDAAALSGQRGGADAHTSELRAIGSVSEVSVSDAVTGHNLITGGALAGASGIPMFIQNSGNGVLIQNAVILNVELH
ncbi:hypothetical protein [Azoarcus sp. KH32C]|uniref:hypothetical protein n=1 Tax=Azoarcus sp. KH32C TaxID=748247 RepID=UPI000238658F|nr:hypothetical protein [Azoarcus sp. KH32C]BAL22570.1 hypothetical protein AZKH_0224 [Azoarcus sp. KH32C]